MDGATIDIAVAFVTATFGIFLLACAVQGWFVGSVASLFVRVILVVAALFMITGGIVTDAIGLGLTAIGYFSHRLFDQKKLNNENHSAHEETE